jgi:hypothetical protein
MVGKNQLAGQVVRPLVIRTDQIAYRAFFVGTQARTTVAADIVEP